MKNSTRSLKHLFELDSKIAIYVPTTCDISRPCDNTEQLNKTLSVLAGMFGGSTQTDALGCWITTDGELVKERVNIVYSFCTKDAFVAHFDEIMDLCEDLKREMGQEAIALEYNGQMKFV